MTTLSKKMTTAFKSQINENTSSTTTTKDGFVVSTNSNANTPQQSVVTSQQDLNKILSLNVNQIQNSSNQELSKALASVSNLIEGLDKDIAYQQGIVDGLVKEKEKLISTSIPNKENETYTIKFRNREPQITGKYQECLQEISNVRTFCNEYYKGWTNSKTKDRQSCHDDLTRIETALNLWETNRAVELSKLQKRYDSLVNTEIPNASKDLKDLKDSKTKLIGQQTLLAGEQAKATTVIANEGYKAYVSEVNIQREAKKDELTAGLTEQQIKVNQTIADGLATPEIAKANAEAQNKKNEENTKKIVVIGVVVLITVVILTKLLNK